MHRAVLALPRVSDFGRIDPLTGARLALGLLSSNGAELLIGR